MSQETYVENNRVTFPPPPPPNKVNVVVVESLVGFRLKSGGPMRNSRWNETSWNGPKIDPKPIKNTKRHTNRSFHGFFNFCHGQVRKIQLRKVAKIYRRLYGGGQVCAPHHTNVRKISWLWEGVSSLVFNKSLKNLAILLILRQSFQ